MNLSTALEERAVEIARTTPFRLQDVREALTDGVRVFGEQKAMEILAKYDIQTLAIAAAAYPALPAPPLKKPLKDLLRELYGD